MRRKIFKSCPCCSGESYSDCCQKYHKGALPENALLLMRSRFSAYALGLVDYIIETTDPSGPEYNKDVISWKKEIDSFLENSEFEDLEIIDFQDGKKEAFVTFIAHLKTNGSDNSFLEKSYFIFNGRWLYHSGVVNSLNK